MPMAFFDSSFTKLQIVNLSQILLSPISVSNTIKDKNCDYNCKFKAMDGHFPNYSHMLELPAQFSILYRRTVNVYAMLFDAKQWIKTNISITTLEFYFLLGCFEHGRDGNDYKIV